MTDFQTVRIEMSKLSLDVERHVEGHRYHGPFSSTGTLAGQATLTFPSKVLRAVTAVSSFHYETKDDHHIDKLKLETSASLLRADRGEILVGVEGAFKDSTPDDDFRGKPFVMSATVLCIVERDEQ
ncbi:hypothetical protein [Rubrivirga sp.]|uniref:hypothetical protein n=1 Tax=Rubrivirga sp. TaxID=1885344 RepID=UPI003C733ED6